MKIPRKCAVCSKDFTAIKDTQHFCSRRCFKRDYYRRNKLKTKDIKYKYPQYHCPVCGCDSQMMFDPLKKPHLFQGFICPFCGIPRAEVFEQKENPLMRVGFSFTAQFVISSAIVSSFTNQTSS